MAQLNGLRTTEVSNRAVAESQPRLSTPQRKQRKREIRKLMKVKPRLSAEDEEEERIIKAQTRGLKHLKRICEALHGRKITENCVADQDLQVADASNDDVTTAQRLGDDAGERSLNAQLISEDRRGGTMPPGMLF